MEEVKQFMRFFTVDSFKPNKNEDYLAKYLHVYYSIQRIKPTNKYFYFDVLQFVLFFPFFYFILLYFQPSKESDAVLNDDIAAYCHFEKSFNFLLCLYVCLMIKLPTFIEKYKNLTNTKIPNFFAHLSYNKKLIQLPLFSK